MIAADVPLPSRPSRAPEAAEPELPAELPPLDHLCALTDDTGTIQHATYDIPNRSTGYCVDDVARAFVVAIRVGRANPAERERALAIARTSLAFLVDAQMPDGRFHNFFAYDRTWLDEVGTEDANGRAIGALGFGAVHAPTLGARRLCVEALVRALPALPYLAHVRSKAYAAVGLVHALGAAGIDASRMRRELHGLADDLATACALHARADWWWFEDVLTYDNARLCEAAFVLGDVLGNPALLALAARTFDFLCSVTMDEGTFVPIGSNGWFHRDGSRARFAQQPLEAAAQIDAALAAAACARRHPHAAIAREARYRELAHAGRAWFDGHNVLGLVLGTSGGACHDGLEAFGLNANLGAESTLAYLGAAYVHDAATRPVD